MADFEPVDGSYPPDPVIRKFSQEQIEDIFSIKANAAGVIKSIRLYGESLSKVFPAVEITRKSIIEFGKALSVSPDGKTVEVLLD